MCFFIFNHKNTNKMPLCAVYSIFKIWGQISDVCELWICKSVTVLSLLWLIFTKHQISDLNLPLCAVYSIFKIWGQISDVCELWICKSVPVLSLLWLIFAKHQISDLNLVFTAFFTILVAVFFVKNKSTLKRENFDILFFFVSWMEVTKI